MGPPVRPHAVILDPEGRPVGTWGRRWGDRWGVSGTGSPRSPSRGVPRHGDQRVPLTLPGQEHRHGVRGGRAQPPGHRARRGGEEEAAPGAGHQDALCAHPLLRGQVRPGPIKPRCLTTLASSRGESQSRGSGAGAQSFNGAGGLGHGGRCSLAVRLPRLSWRALPAERGSVSRGGTCWDTGGWRGHLQGHTGLGDAQGVLGGGMALGTHTGVHWYGDGEASTGVYWDGVQLGGIHGRSTGLGT